MNILTETDIGPRLLIVGILVLFAFFPAIIAGRKGYSPVLWWCLGVLLPIVSILIAVVMPPNAAASEQADISSGKLRPCPSCAEPIRAEAIRCRFCGADVAHAPRAGMARAVTAAAETTCPSCGHHFIASGAQRLICPRCKSHL